MSKTLRNLFFAIVAFTSFTLNAQEEPTGKFAIDLTFDPAAIFDAGAGAMFDMPMIKGRFFINPSFAIRVGIDYNWSNSKDYLDIDGDDYIKEAMRMVTFTGGVEKQFGTAKFKPYVGGDIMLQNMGTRTETEFAGNNVIEYHTNGGYFATGVYAVLGADYYLLPNLYIGAEFAPGIVSTLYKDQKRDGEVIDKGGRSTSASLSSSSGLRVGFRF